MFFLLASWSHPSLCPWRSFLVCISEFCVKQTFSQGLKLNVKLSAACRLHGFSGWISALLRPSLWINRRSCLFPSAASSISCVTRWNIPIHTLPWDGGSSFSAVYALGSPWGQWLDLLCIMTIEQAINGDSEGLFVWFIYFHKCPTGRPIMLWILWLNCLSFLHYPLLKPAVWWKQRMQVLIIAWCTPIYPLF